MRPVVRFKRSCSLSITLLEMDSYLYLGEMRSSKQTKHHALTLLRLRRELELLIWAKWSNFITADINAILIHSRWMNLIFLCHSKSFIVSTTKLRSLKVWIWLTWNLSMAKTILNLPTLPFFLSFSDIFTLSPAVLPFCRFSRETSVICKALNLYHE